MQLHFTGSIQVYNADLSPAWYKNEVYATLEGGGVKSVNNIKSCTVTEALYSEIFHILHLVVLENVPSAICAASADEKWSTKPDSERKSTQ